jgi:hypothetical protein
LRRTHGAAGVGPSARERLMRRRWQVTSEEQAT